MIGRPRIPDEHMLPELPIAEVPRRSAAYVLDVLLLAAVLMTVQALIFQFAWGGERAAWLSTGPRIYGFEWLTFSLPVWLYFALLESGPREATLGKRWLGLQVTNPFGERIGRGRAFVRTVIKLAPWELTHVAILLPTPMWDAGKDAAARPLLIVSTVLFGAWFGAVLLVPKAQGVHDLIAGTLVLDRRPDRKAASADAADTE